ncbi:hypothetical protein JG687_00007255 [Phytophthora cactorum]|uniref:Uncharacterized protein n=1 Tax=Phytophthora cactorum TaxID=29920 RepID=A0A329S0W5_9STRA|nr:hypothetical protein GQ600_26939 [Phytophthora cactorum]KAF1794968.1 hypothetical protein GQ600_16826 [Phytophthora cactorum]KAG2819040.1 hypothetical protein PC112_g12370 [Phytophthora cactorum]KAG2822447.1 hypothetical protein PC111_g10617 [Phytophthora cactorum]KAG2854978.1 hypothetical protein PC113_g12849 [Phytophthora cactorum]
MAASLCALWWVALNRVVITAYALGTGESQLVWYLVARRQALTEDCAALTSINT